MPADASIYSMMQPVPRIRGPLEMTGQALQVRNLMGAGELQGLQRDQIRQQMEAAPAAAALEAEQKRAMIGKTQAETDRARAETTAKNIGIMRDAIAQARSDADMPNLRAMAQQLFPQTWDKIGVPDRFDPQWQMAKIKTADQVLAQIEAEAGRAVAVRGQDVGAATARRGQDIGAATARRGQDMTAATAAGAATREALNKVNTQENLMRDDFTNASKEFVKVRDAHQRVMASAQDPSAAGDLALIFNYMKVLDPGSTVREGEFANAQNSGGVDQRTIALYNSVTRGERLSPEVRADFLNRSGRLYEAAVGNQKIIEDDYTAKAGRAGARPEQVVTRYRVQERKSLGGKNYIKRDGQWYEE